MKSYEIYTALDHSIVTQILDWFRKNDRNVYNTTVSTIATARKLRPVFVQKKSVVDQYLWIHKMLKLSSCQTIGEHLLQAYLMIAQQPMLAAFCDGMSMPHDGKGSVIGDLPATLDATALKSTVDNLLKVNESKMVSAYLHCFNLQSENGWEILTELLKNDDRLKLA